MSAPVEQGLFRQQTTSMAGINTFTLQPFMKHPGRYSPPHFQDLALLFFSTPLFFFSFFSLDLHIIPTPIIIQSWTGNKFEPDSGAAFKTMGSFPFLMSPPPTLQGSVCQNLSLLHLGFLPLPPLPPLPLAPFPPQLAVSTFGRNYFCLPNLPTSSAPCC